jgi:hypothetical protein
LSKSVAPAGIAKAPTDRQCFGVSPNLVGISAISRIDIVGR